MKKIVLVDRRVKVPFIVEETKPSTHSVHRILHESLETKKVSARWVPRMLTDAQKQARLNISRVSLVLLQQDSDLFLTRFITKDKT